MKEDRQKEILRLLQLSSPISVNELTKHFSVTPTTIRRDLAELEESNQITRLRGEAHRITESLVPTFDFRRNLASEEKKRLGLAASKFIEDGDSIIIDSGTTTLCIAPYLPAFNTLTVITNSIPLTYFLAKTRLNTLVSGGILDGNTMCLIGPEAEQYFNGIRVSKLFISSSGVRGTEGLTSFSPFQCYLKKKMIQSAEKVYALIDSTKFSKPGVNLFADFSEIDTLILSQPLDNPELEKRLKELNTNIVIADETF